MKSAYYYIVKDVDHFNTGLKIVANGFKAVRSGVCQYLKLRIESLS